MTLIALGAALVSLGLLAFSILEVRRLPSESEVGHLSRYPRRFAPISTDFDGDATRIRLGTV
jgi:hypothetical protein